jgi:hypothetical protein
MHIVQSAYRIGCFLIDMLTGLGSCGISDLAARTHSSIQKQSRWHRVQQRIGREILATDAKKTKDCRRQALKAQASVPDVRCLLPIGPAALSAGVTIVAVK